MRIYALLYDNMQFYARYLMVKKIIICLLLFTTIACKEKIEEPVIKLGTSPDYPPFEYKKDGEVVGFDIALVKAIAEKLDIKLEIQELEFGGLIPALQSGKVDFIASGLTVTPERSANVDFSYVYYQTSIVGIAKEGVDIGSLDNKKIGAQLGSIMESFAKDKQNELSNINIVSLGNNLHLLQELKLGRIDVLLLEEGQVKEILGANPGLIAHVFPKSGDGYAMAFRKGSELKDKFNQAIGDLKKEGSIEKIADIWFNQQAQAKSGNLWKALTYIPAGILVTLQYALISVFFGLVIGTILSLFRVSSSKLLKGFAICYLSIFRGTPLLLQLSIMYFAMPSLLGIEISAFAAGIIAFSMNSGQFEAAKSLGMSYRVMMQNIIMPQAIRNILPSLVNEAINMVKESSIISVIGAADIMRRANVVSAEQYSYLEPLMVAAVCYYILVIILSLAGKLLEKRLKKQ
jgi:arginine/lysine/histidine transporter system substrate-binding protein